MNRLDMGRAMAFLLRHRRLETLPRGKGRADERELARLLSEADAAARAELEGLLQGVGFDLVHLDDFKTQGLAPGGEIFLLVRRLDHASALFSERWIDERMHLRNDLVTNRRIWFTQLWFVSLFLFYTRRGRIETEVARYVETTFTRADLVEATHEYINDLVRKLGSEACESDAVYSCLLAESGAKVDKYADRFLGLMVDGALIDELGGNRYRQSLLGAVEMKNNHLQGLQPWIQATSPLEVGHCLLVRIVDAEDV